MIRLLAALAIAPLAVVPVLVVLSAPGFGGLVALLTGALVVSYPALILFGLPAHLVLAWTRYTSLLDYTLLGGLLGGLAIAGYCAVAIVFDAHFHLNELAGSIGENFRWGAVGTLYFGSCGAAMGAAFWRLLKRSSL